MIRARQIHLIGCAWFWAWAVVGAGAALSVVSFIGTLTGLPVIAVGLVMASRTSVRRSAFGLVSGAGVLLLVVAWINRAGNGVDPRPWLVLGAILLVAGIAAHALRERG